MSSVVGGPSEVETFLSRLIDGQFEIDTAHPNAKAFQSALNTYRVYKWASVVPTPQNVEDIRSAIYTAISQGVISQEEKTSISLPVR
jgi:hypothetical protein